MGLLVFGGIDMKYNLKISLDYLNRDDAGVLNWIIKYCKRNKIAYQSPDDYLELNFRSNNQLNCFVRLGNEIYRYFEFI